MKFRILATIALAALLSACGGEDEGGSHKGTGHQSATYKRIEGNINTLGTRQWTDGATADGTIGRADYDDILNNQIKKHLKKDKEKKALGDKLDRIYAKTIVAEGRRILSDCSSAQHKTLGAAVKELNSFPKAEGKDDFMAAYKKHQQQMGVVGSIHAKQKVTDISESYDAAFEPRMDKAAEAVLAEKPTCSAVVNGLSKSARKAAYQARRRAYVAALIDLYCEGTEYQAIVENKVLGKVNEAGVTLTPDQKKKMADFKEEHKKPEV